MLGAATPTASLVRTVRDTAASALVLWAQRAGTGDPGVLRALAPHGVRLFTAGPGWPPAGHSEAEHLDGLSQALAVLAGPAA
jgi:hypothetical protein